MEPSLKRQKPNGTPIPPLTLGSLPDELLVDILSYVPQKTAVHLLHSSKRFTRPCRIRLYRHIVLCEKLHDPYFVHLTTIKCTTLVSSWVNILNFLEKLFTAIKSDDPTPEFVSYIESISSYNVLDSGKVDAYRNNIMNSDIRNMLKLRMLWGPVMESLPKLQHLIVPLLPLEKLLFLEQPLKSIAISLEFSSEKIFSQLTPFPHTTHLLIDFTDSSYAKSIPSFLKLFPSLKHLEINGNFSRHDRRLEYTLRHHSLYEDMSVRVAYRKGLKASRKDSDISDFSDLDSASDSEASDDLRHEESQKNNSTAYSTLDYTLCGRVCTLAADINKAAYVLHNLTLSNILLANDIELDAAHELVEAQLAHGELKELHLRGMASRTWPDERRGAGRLTSLLLGQEVKAVNESIQSLTLGEELICQDIHPHSQSHVPSLIKCIEVGSFRFPNLKNLTVFVHNYALPSRALIKVLGLYQCLETVTLIDHDSITSVSKKVASCMAVARSCDGQELDDSLYLTAKEVTEFMIVSQRLDDYGQSTGVRLDSEYYDTYGPVYAFLFGKKVLSIFEDLPTLKVFNYHGYPFRRPELK